jgi:hypothetical protein
MTHEWDRRKTGQANLRCLSKDEPHQSVRPPTHLSSALMWRSIWPSFPSGAGAGVAHLFLLGRQVIDSHELEGLEVPRIEWALNFSR